ncbi:MAG: YraN family protein [Kineosporiaceae bacterium]|nr:YraN family protein [Kineosporiaceae bacterium]
MGTGPTVVDQRALDRLALGEFGERRAARYLSETGLQILERRWRCRWGEADIIAEQAAEGEPCHALVICEVKTRRSLRAGTALDAVTPVKLARLHRVAAAWLAGQDRWFPLVRFDVVAVTVPRRGAPVIEHLQGVL